MKTKTETPSFSLLGSMWSVQQDPMIRVSM